MVFLYWVAAAWLVAAAVITLAFVCAKRSQRLYAWLYGEKPASGVVRLSAPQTQIADPGSRLAA